MCRSLLFSHLPQKNDLSVVNESLKPEGPLGSYLCDVTLPAQLISCQFSFLWTKKFNKDFYLWKKFGLFLFLTDKFLYPCVSFVSLSLLSLTMLLFKIRLSLSCIYWLAISTCVFTTLAIIGTMLVCVRFGSRVSYIKNFNLFLFVPDYSAMRHAIPGLLLDIFRVGEDFYGGEAD